jgi:hypothetical protein
LRAAVGRPQMQDHNLMASQGNLFDTIYRIIDSFIANGFKYFLIISFTKLCNLFVAIIIIIIIIIKLLIKEVTILIAKKPITILQKLRRSNKTYRWFIFWTPLACSIFVRKSATTVL